MSVRAPDICDADELVARAAAMRETLRERQAECEALGRLPDETNRDYVEAGFFRVIQPRRFGGFELGLQAFLRVAVELSRGCPSSGWVYALTWTAQAHAAVERGIETTDEDQRRLLMICQQIVELCAEAVDIVFRTAGTSATRNGEAIERCFRDINMIRTHVTMQFDRTFEHVGQMRLGLPPAGFF